MIESVQIYTGKELHGYKIGEGSPKIAKIRIFFGTITITFEDGYKIIYKSLPYSVGIKARR